MAHFSVTEDLAAREPWSIEIRGKVFTALPVSRPALLAWLGAIGDPSPNERRIERAVKGVLRVAFPARWRYCWPGQIDPVFEILNADIESRDRALNSFFEFALTPLRRPSGRSPTNGRSAASPCSVEPTRSPAGSS